MEWFAEENGDNKACTGKPKSMGGLPHELGSTGFGVSLAARIAADNAGFSLKGASVVVEGFGNVGQFAAKYLSEFGAVIVAASDSRGVICSSQGLDPEKLTEIKEAGGSVVQYPDADSGACDDILDIEADILITAAVPDLIKPGDVDRLKFRVIVEGSNIPMKVEVEELCFQKKILVVPDFVANAGGVISSYVEYIGGSEKEMFSMIETKITENTKRLLEKAQKDNAVPRHTALAMARELVREKCRICRVD
jgi:glutamate dehydrogenase (NAD(P)+)